MMLATRGMGGRFPGIVTAGFGSGAPIVIPPEPPIVTPPSSGGGGGGGSHVWTPTRRRKKKRGDVSFDWRAEDEIVLTMIDQFMRDLGNG